MAANGSRPLVICYGNPLRSDDGVAWRVADRLAGDARIEGTEVLCRQQLTPELAAEVSRSARVVLVDAEVGGPPGTVHRTLVAVPSGASDPPGARWSHDLTPARLAALAAALFGRTPRMDLVSVAAASFDVGEDLSVAVEAAVDRAVDAVAALVSTGGSRPSASTRTPPS